MKHIHTIILYLILSTQALSLSGATFYIDPLNGNINNDGSENAPWSTMEEVIENEKIESYKNAPLPYDPAINQLVLSNEGAPVKSGDTLILRNGMHGEVFLQNYNNSSFITVMAQSGHTPILEFLRLQACKNWRFEGLDISSEPSGYYLNGRLVFFETHNWQGPSSHIDLVNCHIYSGTDSSTWTAANWLNKVSLGVYFTADHVQVLDCIFHNISMGISIIGDSCRVVNNQIINFSGDGIRILGSYNLIEGNTIKNCYKVDENHDDGMQSFYLGGSAVDYNTVRGNTILNYEDPNQPLLGKLQGMGFFDGPYRGWIVENNVVSVDHWHGITFLGAYDCQITNNTVIDPTPNSDVGPSWIMIDDHKDGTPSDGCIVKNNVANSFFVDAETANNMVLTSISEYQQNFENFETYSFNLIENSPLIDAADDAAAPDTDITGLARPQGEHSDIGAYEFEVITNATLVLSSKNNLFYPNPVQNTLTIDLQNIKLNEQTFIVIKDQLGRSVFEQKINVQQQFIKLDLKELGRGCYVIFTGEILIGKVVKM